MASEQLSLAWCDVCHRELHSDESRARGRGPVCYAKRHPRQARVPRPRGPVHMGPDLFDVLREEGEGTP